MAGGGKSSVAIAVVGNSILTIIKLIAFLVSGSGAMLSETIHSAADSANQGLLYLGIRRSQRPADARFPYGYGGERFFFAFMSAVGIFVLGCGVTIYHGISTIIHPPQIHFSLLTFVVLIVAFVIESAIFFIALRETLRKKGDQPFWSYVRSSTDPTLLAVLFEDFIAGVGVLIAMAGIGLSYWTGNMIFDSLSSIAIGGLLGIMAIWLGLRNRVLLLGPAIPKDIKDKVIALLEAEESVDKVRLARTRVVGAERFRLAVEVDYNGYYLGKQQAEWVKEQLTEKRDNLA